MIKLTIIEVSTQNFMFITFLVFFSRIFQTWVPNAKYENRQFGMTYGDFVFSASLCNVNGTV